MADRRQDPCVYICFMATMTTIAKISRRISGCDYTHISIAFDGKLEDFVSFSRRSANTPLDAGIVWERRGDYVQPGQTSYRTKIYRIPVGRNDLERIKELIRDYERDPEYMFNIFSMVTMTVFHGFSIYKTENCMSFVGRIIEMTGAVPFSKPCYKYLPEEFMVLLGRYEYFDGMMPADSADKKHRERRIGFWRKSVLNAGILLTLLYRMVFKAGKGSRLKDGDEDHHSGGCERGYSGRAGG